MGPLHWWPLSQKEMQQTNTVFLNIINLGKSTMTLPTQQKSQLAKSKSHFILFLIGSLPKRNATNKHRLLNVVNLCMHWYQLFQLKTMSAHKVFLSSSPFASMTSLVKRNATKQTPSTLHNVIDIGMLTATLPTKKGSSQSCCLVCFSF